MKTTWVVVADEAIARILCWSAEGGELQPVQELTDAKAHAKNGELRDDAYGRRAGSHGTGAGSGTGRQHRGTSTATAGAGLDETHQEAEAFAKSVAQFLAEACQQGRFSDLKVVAAPRFLGLLRKCYSKPLQAAVSVEIDKDLIHAGNDELTGRLFPSTGRQGSPDPG